MIHFDITWKCFVYRSGFVFSEFNSGDLFWRAFVLFLVSIAFDLMLLYGKCMNILKVKIHEVNSDVAKVINSLVILKYDNKFGKSLMGLYIHLYFGKKEYWKLYDNFDNNYYPA